MRPGVEAGEIDGACRSIIAEAGMGDAFIHGSGHGVGLDIHELPRVASGSTAVLEPGNVLTVEPRRVLSRSRGRQSGGSAGRHRRTDAVR